MKNNKKSQSGFAMLEVMLAVIIIAIASFGIYKLYATSSTRSSIATTENVVNQVDSAVNKFANIYMSTPDLSNLINVGYLPTDLTTTTTGDNPVTYIVTPFGNMTYTKGTTTYNSFTLSLTNVPKSAALDLAKDVSTMSDVTVGSAKFAGNGTDVLPADFNGTITMSFPKAGQ
jgi:prepilin-type N-terminal cleavage/methylation domain-containing protein